MLGMDKRLLAERSGMVDFILRCQVMSASEVEIRPHYTALVVLIIT